MKRYKKEDSVSYTLGASLTFQLLESYPEQVKVVYVHPDFREGEAKDRLLALCRARRIEAVTSERAFHILSPKENCFVIGEFEKFRTTLAEDTDHVVLANISNAGNLGTVLRSALGFGYKDVALIRPCTDPYDPKAVRASMGALFGLRVELFDTFEDYKARHGRRSMYPFMLQSNKPLGEVQFAHPHALIFGNESSGLDDSFLSEGEPVIIRHSSEIDSLNLPIAVSIALFAASRDRFSS